ncbi:MAG: TetR/AcrR family transcriptional regulator [Anaerovoracaceae bacterium]
MSKDTMSVKRRRMMKYFIEAAAEIERESGRDAVTLRAVADKAGFNSATLYNYFDDLNHLMLFLSMTKVARYTADLEKALSGIDDPLEKYRKIYEIFTLHCFREPETFGELFFSGDIEKTKSVIETYYQLYPEEIDEQDGSIKKMLMEGDVFDRDAALTKDLVDAGYLLPGNDRPTYVILTHVFHSIIDSFRAGTEKRTPEEASEDFMRLFDYILAAGKIIEFNQC